MKTMRILVGVVVGALLVTTSALAAPFSNSSVRVNLTAGYSKLLSEQVATSPITVPIKVSLFGEGEKSRSDRAPINVALVMDRSGSMSGEKLIHAKEAAISALSLLGSNDIVSIISYDDKPEVVVPATKLTDKEAVIRKISGITEGGSTALFAGVSRGAAELAKFREAGRINRIVLLSDGMANVGPSSPGELGDLGASLQKDGISVTTIGLGLGYNEDLMTNLARRSDGNHIFAERATDLASLFQKEFGGLLSVVAQNVLVTITCSCPSPRRQ